MQNKIDGFRVNNFSDDHKQIPENATDFQNLMEGHRGSKPMHRKSKKFLQRAIHVATIDLQSVI